MKYQTIKTKRRREGGHEHKTWQSPQMCSYGFIISNSHAGARDDCTDGNDYIMTNRIIDAAKPKATHSKRTFVNVE
jgi:hypothetical protein